MSRNPSVSNAHETQQDSPIEVSSVARPARSAAEEATATLRMVLAEVSQVFTAVWSNADRRTTLDGIQDCIANIETAIEELAR
jgi:hypothetical protein